MAEKSQSRGDHGQDDQWSSFRGPRYPATDEEALDRAAAEDLSDELAEIVSEHVQ